MTSRRTAIRLIGMGISIGISALASIGSAAAQNYPNRPVKRMSERLGQQFAIENKPGAGNNIATESVITRWPNSSPM